MADFLKKHTDRLRTAALVLMLLIPFFLFAAAANGSELVVKLLLGAMAANMLLAIKAG